MAILIIIHNKLHLFSDNANMYYMISLLMIFLFSHVVIKFRVMISPKMDVLLHKIFS